MNIEELMQKKLPAIPNDVSIDDKNVTFIPFDKKNEILTNETVQSESGYVRYEKGFFVAMYCEMPGVTKEMLDWWFWWHPQQSIRYKVWFPFSHKRIGYSRKNKKYFTAKDTPPFEKNVQYPREKIGGKTATLRISFVSPEEFGFDRNIMTETSVVGAICGRVGVKWLFDHTEMCHIIKQTTNGVTLISRFWMGERLKTKTLAKTILTENLAKGMAEHCCVEYRNLSEILPKLYSEFSNNK